MSGYPPQPYILQSGTITPGHGLVWAANGVVEDSGFPPIDLPSGPEGYYFTASGLPGTVVYVQPNSAGGPAILDSNDTLSEQLVIPAGTTIALSLATIAASQVANGIPAGSSGALLGLTGVAGIGQSVTTLKNLTIAANASAFPTVAAFLSTPGTLSDDYQFSITNLATTNDRGGGNFTWDASSTAPPDQATILVPTASGFGVTTISGYSIGTGNGSQQTFSGTLPNTNLIPGSISFAYLGGSDAGGFIYGTGFSGTLNTATGAYLIYFNTAPASGQAITISYKYAANAGRAIRNFSGAFNVLWFGANNQGSTGAASQNTNAFQNAFASAVRAGGGVVYAPAGVYYFSLNSWISNSSGQVAGASFGTRKR